MRKKNYQQQTPRKASRLLNKSGNTQTDSSDLSSLTASGFAWEFLEVSFSITQLTLKTTGSSQSMLIFVI